MICDCGHESSCFTIQLNPRGARKVCRNCRTPRVRESVFNPYADLTMEHVHGDDGRPLRVTSLRELREAEKRHQFKALVSNTDEARFDHPPQTRTPDLFEQMTENGGWLFPEHGPDMVRELRECGELD